MQINQYRSLLFVPATSDHLWEKASQRGADAVVIDLEDAIPIDKKQVARAMAPTAIKLLKDKGVDVILRVNSDPTLWQQDLVGMPLQCLCAIMLPKVETKDQVEVFSQALTKLSSATAPPIAALLETPLGVLATPQIASHASLCALGFGAEDYSGAIGGSRPDTNIKGFADPAHYDNIRSSLARPGSTRSVLGQGGLLDAGIGIVRDLQSGNLTGIIGAVQKAGTAYNTFKGANIKSVVNEEANAAVKSVIRNSVPGAVRQQQGGSGGFVFPRSPGR